MSKNRQHKTDGEKLLAAIRRTAAMYKSEPAEKIISHDWPELEAHVDGVLDEVYKVMKQSDECKGKSVEHAVAVTYREIIKLFKHLLGNNGMTRKMLADYHTQENRLNNEAAERIRKERMRDRYLNRLARLDIDTLRKIVKENRETMA